MLRTNAHLLARVFFGCLIFSNSGLCRAGDKTEAVNQQLDMVESSHADEAAQEFSGMQASIPKSQEASSGDMLKAILNPDLLEKPQARNIRSLVKPRTNTLDIGSEIFYYRYQEPDIGVKIHGPMYGYYAEYAYRPADPNFFNNFLTNVYFLQVRYATSHDLEYNGSGTIKDKHDDAGEVRGLLGKDYFIGTGSRVTPYFGFGYRYLFDRGNGELSSTGAYAYDRKAHYYYLPLGTDVVLETYKDWEIDFNAEYDIFLFGRQVSYLSDGDQFTGLRNQNISNNQAHGFGVRASIKFLKKGRWMDFYVEPYVRFWNIEDSKVETAFVDGSEIEGLEPKNNTTEVGSKFGIQF